MANMTRKTKADYGRSKGYKTFDEAMAEVNKKAAKHTNSQQDEEVASRKAVARNQNNAARRREAVNQQKEGMQRNTKFTGRKLNYEADRAAHRSEAAVEGEKTRKVLEDAFRKERDGGKKVQLRNLNLRKKYGR